MKELYLGIALFLLLNLLGGLVRVLRGPTSTDRLLAVQLFGTTGVAILLLLSEGLGQAALRNVALVFAVLAVLATVAFVQRQPVTSPAEPNPPS